MQLSQSLEVELLAEWRMLPFVRGPSASAAAQSAASMNMNRTVSMSMSMIVSRVLPLA